jgi:Effector Associated Constant Component 1
MDDANECIIEIEVDGEGVDRYVRDLKSWLDKEQIPSLKAEIKKGAIVPGTQGAEYLPIVVAVLGAPAVVTLAQSVHTWLQMRKRVVSISIATADGGRVKLDMENPPSLDYLLHVLSTAAKGMKRK